MMTSILTSMRPTAAAIGKAAGPIVREAGRDAAKHATEIAIIYGGGFLAILTAVAVIRAPGNIRSGVRKTKAWWSPAATPAAPATPPQPTPAPEPTQAPEATPAPEAAQASEAAQAPAAAPKAISIEHLVG